jgi:hypothetical protein
MYYMCNVGILHYSNSDVLICLIEESEKLDLDPRLINVKEVSRRKAYPEGIIKYSYCPLRLSVDLSYSLLYKKNNNLTWFIYQV